MPLCLIHIDLDKFKSINDTHGHPTGDLVLRAAAQIMRQLSRESDLVARIGGDEFVILRAPHETDNEDTVRSLCQRIVRELGQPMLINGVECQIGASIGFVISDTPNAASETLMKNADLALYEAKRSGRGAVRQFQSAMRDEVEAKRAFVSELKDAFCSQRIFCVLQPQISLNSGRIVGLEALGRIRSRAGNVFLPGQFLDQLQEANLLMRFDRRVIQCAFQALKELRGEDHIIPTISVNASADSLRSDDFAMFILDELNKHDLSSKDVVVEVLESVLIEEADDLAIAAICQLGEHGIRTVMDDFGSGHASMSSLLQLPVDGIKIDRLLVRNIETERSQQILNATLSLSKGMSLPPLIEGIESQKQFSVLKSMGCRLGQGFGICRPKEPAELSVWLKNYGESEVLSLQDRLMRSQLG